MRALEQYEISLEGIVYPWVTANETLRVTTEDDSGYPQRFFINSISIPLTLGTMSVTASRVTIVG